MITYHSNQLTVHFKETVRREFRFKVLGLQEKVQELEMIKTLFIIILGR